MSAAVKAKRAPAKKGPGSNGAGRNGTSTNVKTAKNGKTADAIKIPRGETAAESPEWRRFVGKWLETHQCKVEAA
ncbi:MAG: hypothetical protein ABL977_15200, partial [Candidatus Eisenbacteria bacterium]